MNKKLVLLSLVGLASATHAYATVDADIDVYIVHRNVQSGAYCYSKEKIIAEFGIPAAVMTEGSLMPHYTWYLSSSRLESINLNEAAKYGKIRHNYISDDYSGNIVEYKAELDVIDVHNANGNSREGRLKTITQAKLALLAINKNFATFHKNNYKLWITFKNLPSQQDLPGTKLPATTQWPYTSGSPIIKNLEKELINVNNGCTP